MSINLSFHRIWVLINLVYEGFFVEIAIIQLWWDQPLLLFLCSSSSHHGWKISFYTIFMPFFMLGTTFISIGLCAFLLVSQFSWKLQRSNSNERPYVYMCLFLKACSKILPSLWLWLLLYSTVVKVFKFKACPSLKDHSNFSHWIISSRIVQDCSPPLSTWAFRTTNVCYPVCSNYLRNSILVMNSVPCYFFVGLHIRAAGFSCRGWVFHVIKEYEEVHSLPVHKSDCKLIHTSFSRLCGQVIKASYKAWWSNRAKNILLIIYTGLWIK